MSNHQIAALAHSWAVGTLAGVILLSLVAYTQIKDKDDYRTARAQVQKQIRGEVRK